VNLRVMDRPEMPGSGFDAQLGRNTKSCQALASVPEPKMQPLTPEELADPVHPSPSRPSPEPGSAGSRQ
jgi:hypothetical protein